MGLNSRHILLPSYKKIPLRLVSKEGYRFLLRIPQSEAGFDICGNQVDRSNVATKNFDFCLSKLWI